jgi:hypothetical protein
MAIEKIETSGLTPSIKEVNNITRAKLSTIPVIIALIHPDLPRPISFTQDGNPKKIADRDAINLGGRIRNVQMKKRRIFLPDNHTSGLAAVIHDPRLCQERLGRIEDILIAHVVHTVIDVKLGAGFILEDNGPHVLQHGEKTARIAPGVTETIGIARGILDIDPEILHSDAIRDDEDLIIGQLLLETLLEQLLMKLALETYTIYFMLDLVPLCLELGLETVMKIDPDLFRLDGERQPRSDPEPPPYHHHLEILLERKRVPFLVINTIV